MGQRPGWNPRTDGDETQLGMGSVRQSSGLQKLPLLWNAEWGYGPWAMKQRLISVCEAFDGDLVSRTYVGLRCSQELHQFGVLGSIIWGRAVLEFSLSAQIPVTVCQKNE